MKKRKNSLEFIAFFQALGLVAYCSLIALLLWQGSNWFGKLPNYFGPFLFLTLFTTSALISAIIVGAYPFILYFNKKKTQEAIRLVFYTASWLLIFVLGILFIAANIS